MTKLEIGDSNKLKVGIKQASKAIINSQELRIKN